MEDVREKLTDLAKALGRVERLYVRISTLGTGARAEASTRLILAEEAVAGPDKLLEVLETATNIVNRAVKDLPQQQRTAARNSAEFVRLILQALHLGHVEHFKCTGYGDTPIDEAAPPFLIRVARKKKPFPDIAHIVAEATGGDWSVDDAIRAYLEQGEPQVNLRRRKRH